MVLLRKHVPSLAAGLVALAALALYALTVAPGLTLAHGGTDGAELAVAVHTRGVPHPSGYPTYVLLAQVFRALPWGDLAGRLNLFSTLAAALAAGTLALAAAGLSPGEEGHLPAVVAALTAGLSLAVSGLFWSQALITEVYALHTLFITVVLWLLLRWRQRRGSGLLLAGLALGLGLGNHLSLLFMLPGMILFLWLSRRRLRGRDIGLAGGLFLAGLTVYLYLPLRAAADPWLNWGDPRDWTNFWTHVSGEAYQGLLFRVPWPQVAQRLAAAAGFLLRDMAPWGVLLGLGGAFVLGRRDRPCLLLTALPAGLGLLLALSYGGADSHVHLLPLYLTGTLWAGVAAGTLTAALGRRLGKKAAWVALLLPLLSLVLAVWYGPTWSLRADPGPLPRYEVLWTTLPDQALLLSDRDEHTFPLWYAQQVEGERLDLAVVDVRLLEWTWYRRQLPRRCPDLAVPAEGAEEWGLAGLLEANPSRPAYTLDPLALPPGYHLRREGPLYRVMPP